MGISAASAFASPISANAASDALDALRDPATAALKAKAASDPKSVIKAAAQQFEALFMQQLMKSMRESSMASGLLDNAGTQMGTEMLDTQFANKMTGLPGGLGDVIARQLERQMNGNAAAVPAAGAAGAPAAGDKTASVKPTQEEFLRMHQGAARAAEDATGIPASFMVAQAAHESGWGRHEIKNRDGSSSHNLFGIKAGPGWSGKTTNVVTTEVVGGETRKVVAKFRSYASYDESFKDYAKLMKDNPRYSSVVASAAGSGSAGGNAQAFARGLQRAGYATDPAYADKLTRVINTTLRMQRATLNAPLNASGTLA